MTIESLRIDQAGLALGTAGQSRDDGLNADVGGGLAATVTLTDTDPQTTSTWELLSVAPGDDVATGSLAPSGHTCTFTPKAGAVGSYRIQLTQDAGLPTQQVEIRTFGIRTENLGLRIPAHNEKADPDATIANAASMVAESETNAPTADYPSGSPQGWHPSEVELYEAVDAGVRVHEDGALIGSRPRLNFIGATVTDDPIEKRVDIEIMAGGASVGATLPVTIEPDATASAGVSAEASRVDHRHAIAAAAAGAILIGDSAAEGASTSFARADHTHSVAAPASPAQLGAGTSATGAATGPARADHAHRPRVTIGAVNVLDIDTDGQVTILGGTGGAGLPGEPVAITAGAGGTGNTAGADLTLEAGTKSGSGLAGRVYLGASTARQIIAGSSATTLVQVQSDALSLIPPGGTEGTRDVATVLSVSPASAVAPWSLILVEGDPNGQLAAATAGSLAADLTNKRLYIKAADSPSTVWNRVDSGGATLQTAYDAGEVIAATDADGPVEINDSAYTAASNALSLLSIGGSALATATAPAVTATAAGTARPAVYQAVPAMTDPAQGGNYGIGYRINPASLVSGHVDVMIVDGDPNGIAGPNAGTIALDRGGGTGGKIWVKVADSPSTTWTRIAGTSGAGAASPSLQSVYEDGGDNDVSITAADGPIILRGSADNTNLLELRRTTAGGPAGNALFVDVDAATNGAGIYAEHGNPVSAAIEAYHSGASGAALYAFGDSGAGGLLAQATDNAAQYAARAESYGQAGALKAYKESGLGGGDIFNVGTDLAEHLIVDCDGEITVLSGAGATASPAEPITITGGVGGAASAGAAGGIGGGITILGGTGGAASSAQVANAGGSISIVAGAGGAGDAGNNRAGGLGATLTIYSGDGAAAAGTQAGRNGGALTVRPGVGGAAGASAAGGSGGAASYMGGWGGASSSAQPAGGGSTANLVGGDGGESTSSGSGGAGARAIVRGGHGGSSTSGTGGAAGGVQIKCGNTGSSGGSGDVAAADIEIYLTDPTGAGRHGALKFAEAVARSAPISLPYVNKSGGTLNPGDVVVPYTSATDQGCTTTTTAGVRPLGVVVVGGAADATVWVCQFGVCKVNVRTTDNVNIARGDTLITSTTAANAWGLTGSTSLNGTPLGIALGAASSNTTIWAFVMLSPVDAMLPRSPPTSSPSPTGLYTLDNSLADSSGNGRTTLSLAGGATNRYCQGATPNKRAWRTLVTAYGDGLQLTAGNSGWAQLTGAMSCFCRVAPITDVRATVDQTNRVLVECGASDAAGGTNNTAWRMMFGFSTSVIVEWYSGATPTKRSFETTELCKAVGRSFVLGFTRSAGGVVKVYRDGVLIGTSGALTMPDGVTNGRFCVGVSMSHAGYAYGGADISDVAVYSSELSQTDVDLITRRMLGDYAYKESI